MVTWFQFSARNCVLNRWMRLFQKLFHPLLSSYWRAPSSISWTPLLDYYLVRFYLLYFCFSFISELMNKWDQSPVILTMSEKATPIWQISFPAGDYRWIEPRIVKWWRLYIFSYNLSKWQSTNNYTLDEWVWVYSFGLLRISIVSNLQEKGVVGLVSCLRQFARIFVSPSSALSRSSTIYLQQKIFFIEN